MVLFHLWIFNKKITPINPLTGSHTTRIWHPQYYSWLAYKTLRRVSPSTTKRTFAIKFQVIFLSALSNTLLLFFSSQTDCNRSFIFLSHVKSFWFSSLFSHENIPRIQISFGNNVPDFWNRMSTFSSHFNPFHAFWHSTLKIVNYVNYREYMWVFLWTNSKWTGYFRWFDMEGPIFRKGSIKLPSPEPGNNWGITNSVRKANCIFNHNAWWIRRDDFEIFDFLPKVIFE